MSWLSERGRTAFTVDGLELVLDIESPASMYEGKNVYERPCHPFRRETVFGGGSFRVPSRVVHIHIIDFSGSVSGQYRSK